MNTHPDSLCDLRLRFSTKLGARTITASKIPLRDASVIAEAMRAAGHEAAILEHQGGDKRVRALIRALSRKSSRTQNNVIPLSKGGTSHVRIERRQLTQE